MTEAGSDDGWEIVPIDTPQLLQAGGTDRRTHAPSWSLIELRINIGCRHWDFQSRPGHHHRHGRQHDHQHNHNHIHFTSPNEAQQQKPLERSPLEQQQSILFQIPVEIRLYIYELVLTLPSPFKMTPQPYQHKRNQEPDRHSVLTLLETCRLILHEAETIFYSINRLSLTAPDQIPNFVSQYRRESINRLTISSTKAIAAWPCIKSLDLTPNLQSLYIGSPTDGLRYVDVKTWKIMLPQMETVLKSLKFLREVKVLWSFALPDVPEPGEADRLLKLEQIARRLEASVVSS